MSIFWCLPPPDRARRIRCGAIVENIIAGTYDIDEILVVTLPMRRRRKCKRIEKRITAQLQNARIERPDSASSQRFHFHHSRFACPHPAALRRLTSNF